MHFYASRSGRRIAASSALLTRLVGRRRWCRRGAPVVTAIRETCTSASFLKPTGCQAMKRFVPRFELKTIGKHFTDDLPVIETTGE